MVSDHHDEQRRARAARPPARRGVRARIRRRRAGRRAGDGRAHRPRGGRRRPRRGADRRPRHPARARAGRRPLGRREHLGRRRAPRDLDLGAGDDAAARGVPRRAPARVATRSCSRARRASTTSSGLQMASSIIGHAGYDVRLFGADLPVASIAGAVARHRPAVVGFTSATVLTAVNLPAAFEAVRRVSAEHRARRRRAGHRAGDGHRPGTWRCAGTSRTRSSRSTRSCSGRGGTEGRPGAGQGASKPPASCSAAQRIDRTIVA